MRTFLNWRDKKEFRSNLSPSFTLCFPTPFTSPKKGIIFSLCPTSQKRPCKTLRQVTQPTPGWKETAQRCREQSGQASFLVLPSIYYSQIVFTTCYINLALKCSHSGTMRWAGKSSVLWYWHPIRVPVHVPGAPFQRRFPDYGPWRWQKMAQVLESLNPYRRSRESSCLLALEQLSSGYCDHVGSKPVNKRLSRSTFLFLKCAFQKPHLQKIKMKSNWI